MRLGDALRATDTASLPPEPVAVAASSRRKLRAAEPAPAPKPTNDSLVELKLRAQEALFSRLGARLYDSSLSEEQLRETVVDELDALIREEPTPLTTGERHQ